ncbi:hypothetical protein [Geminisphaera colitermitum]|uniref:hypothetical protein n=1 Tax=Geminisphaera colitermitum TaxID=1148786 RepID=UPI0012FF16D4|nr:hypothetical protein [Geminisphaera colitermitum]
MSFIDLNISVQTPVKSRPLPATGRIPPAPGARARRTRLLDKEAYRSTFSTRMHPTDFQQPLPFGFQLYAAFIPKTDYRGFDCSGKHIHSVWISDTTPFLHVLIAAKEYPNVFMVVVIDRLQHAIYGHRLVDLRQD